MIPGEKGEPIEVQSPVYRGCHTLTECKEMLDEGKSFGEAYPNLHDPADREALKAYFVHTPDLPIHRAPPPATIDPLEVSTNTVKAPSGNHAYTGNTCTRCYGVHMVRNGTCELCLDCGETSGCS